MRKVINTKSKISCDFCNKTTQTNYNLMRVFIKTSKNSYEIGMVKLMEYMNPWILKKLYHLSPTEILLLRPDLFIEFLNDWKPDEVVESWFFVDYRCCLDCYEDYKKGVPER